MDNQLAKTNALPEEYQAFGFLYEGGVPRFSVDKTECFVVKKGGEVVEKVPELKVMILSPQELYSHRQPDPKNPNDKGKPTHVEEVEYCESRNGKKTSVGGSQCSDCLAYKACGYKIELRMSVAGRDSNYLLTLPEVSAYRLKSATQQLWDIHQLRPWQVVWQMWVKTEKNSYNNDFPVVQFKALNAETGDELSLQKKEQPKIESKPKSVSKAPTMADFKKLRDELRTMGVTLRTVDGGEVNTPAGLKKVYDEHMILLEDAKANIPF